MKGRKTPLLFSVVVPTHNRAALIGRALSSVLPQCGEGDEVIVVDDGSTDDTEARLAPYRGRVAYKKVPNGGAGRARNLGMDLARNPLIAFLDSDDEWLPGKLRLQRALFQARPDVLSCFTDFGYKHSSGSERRRRNFAGCEHLIEGFLGPRVPFSSIAPLPEGQSDFELRVGDLYPWLLNDEFGQIGSVALRRALVERGVRFPEDLRTREDWEFMARLAREGPIAYMDIETELVHLHDGPQLTKLDALMTIEARLRVLPRLWGADKKFLAEQGARYERALDDLRLRRAGLLLGRGRNVEAREQLRQVRQAKLGHLALSYVPGGLLSFARDARKYLWGMLA